MCFRLCDDAAGFQVEVSDAARHGEPPVNVCLTDAVPRQETTKLLDPEHKNQTRSVTFSVKPYEAEMVLEYLTLWLCVTLVPLI